MNYCISIQPYVQDDSEIENINSSDGWKLSPRTIGSPTSDEWSQCGKILVENKQRFLLVCCLCRSKFSGMDSFSVHIASEHWPLDNSETNFLEDDANPGSDSFKNEISDGRAECVESDDGGLSDDMLEELRRIDECQGISSYEDVSQKQSNSNNRNDVFDVKNINLFEEKWIQSDKRNEEMHDEDSASYADEHTSTFQTKIEPENSTSKTIENLETEVDNEDSMSDDFRDLYEQIGREIEAEKRISAPAGEEDPPKYFCTKCNLQCTERSYSLHMRAQHGILSKQMKAKYKRGKSLHPWKCKVCGKMFQIRSALLRHQIVHTGERPHQCPYCPRAFASRTNLSTHIRIHLGIKKHPCSYCDKRYVTSSAKVLHERSHTQVYPFQCEECGRLFRHIHNLRDHATVHTDITYDCPSCDKKFKRKEQLRAHKTTHRKQNVNCEICNRSFASQKNLRIHMDIHSAEKKYVCSCGKAYSQYSGLYSHRKAHSKDPRCGNS